MLFETEKRKLTRLPAEPVGPLTRKAAIEIFRTAHLDHLQLKSTMPLVELTGLVKNTPLKLKTSADLVKAILRYAQYTGASATKEKQNVVITYGAITAIIHVKDSRGVYSVVKSLPTKEPLPNQGTEAGHLHCFTVSTFEEFLQQYINEILIKCPIPASSQPLTHSLSQQNSGQQPAIDSFTFTTKFH